MEGVRRDGWQRILCKDCGETFFILPANPYPVPKSRQEMRRPTRRPIDDDPTSASLPAPASASPPAETATRETDRPRRRTRASKPRGIELPTKPTSGGRLQGPIRWVLLVAVAAIAATVYGVALRRSTERAGLMLRKSVAAGQAALDAGDFATASRHFQQASHAVKQLGRDDPEARWIHQMARESLAAGKLAAAPLFEIALEADEAYRRDAWREWQQHFKLSYADTWIVLQTELFRVTDLTGNTIYTLDYPLAVNGMPLELAADLEVFKRLPRDSEPRPVLVAAQLQGFERSESGPERWIVTLRPDTAFLWTDSRNLQAIGLGDDHEHKENELRNLLSQQARFMGLE